MTPQALVAVVRSGKERQLPLSRIRGSPASSLEQSALFGKGLLLHQCDKLFKLEQCLVQAFDRKPFDELLLLPDDQLNVHTEIHVLTYPSLLDVIGTSSRSTLPL